ncbi:MAG: hypothetical protein SXA11_15505 [Cyanobacteriota bacterium]|nr:hypothetical protein [Cyanobacteriota bacterium]
MKAYKQITIKVSSEIAENYYRVPEKEREQIELKLADIIDWQLENRRQEAVKELQNLMDRASEKAQSNGLTPEILESILNEDDE